MKLPLLVSVPHAGLSIPSEVEDICTLSREYIAADSDEGAAEIYYGLEKWCEEFIAADIARAVIDLNRAPDDIGGDGVIKSHTCWNVPVYSKFPDESLVATLLECYYLPYHVKLTSGAHNKNIMLGLDCHTMSAIGPPIGPDPGRERPLVCISNNDATCPQDMIEDLAICLEASFKKEVTINKPFRGGYITRSHASEMPWIQVEISRAEACSLKFKQDAFLIGLQHFCRSQFLDRH
jgi:formiminoglutamase